MPRPIITLTTDFGTGSPYVAQMKGAILSVDPEATIVDLSHAIPPQDIRAGALALAQATGTFPDGSIHVAVVDPGVGSERAIVYARFGQQHYVAPDNGLLSALARGATPDRIVTLTQSQFWRPDVSSTFHGRDIMAPAAGHLSRGLDPDALGTEQRELIQLAWTEVSIVPGLIEGTIQSVDSFGNLVTDITAEMLADTPRGDDEVTITCDDHVTTGIFNAYADQPEMTLMALVGSSGFLEIAIVGDSAKIMLGVGAGTPLKVKW